MPRTLSGQELAAASKAWEAWMEGRPEGSLITPLPLPDVQDAAKALFVAGREFSLQEVEGLRGALKRIAGMGGSLASAGDVARATLRSSAAEPGQVEQPRDDDVPFCERCQMRHAEPREGAIKADFYPPLVVPEPASSDGEDHKHLPVEREHEDTPGRSQWDLEIASAKQVREMLAAYPSLMVVTDGEEVDGPTTVVLKSDLDRVMRERDEAIVAEENSHIVITQLAGREHEDTPDTQARELRERMGLIERFARQFSDAACEGDCEGTGIDEEGAEWTLCECALTTLQRLERGELVFREHEVSDAEPTDAEVERAQIEAERLAQLSPAAAEAEREDDESHGHWVARKILAAARGTSPEKPEAKAGQVWRHHSTGDLSVVEVRSDGAIIVARDGSVLPPLKPDYFYRELRHIADVATESHDEVKQRAINEFDARVVVPELQEDVERLREALRKIAYDSEALLPNMNTRGARLRTCREVARAALAATQAGTERPETGDSQ